VSLTKSVYYIIYVYMDAGRGARRRSDGKYDLEKSHPIIRTLAATILDFEIECGVPIIADCNSSCHRDKQAIDECALYHRYMCAEDTIKKT